MSLCLWRLALLLASSSSLSSGVIASSSRIGVDGTGDAVGLGVPEGVLAKELENMEGVPGTKPNAGLGISAAVLTGVGWGGTGVKERGESTGLSCSEAAMVPNVKRVNMSIMLFCMIVLSLECRVYWKNRRCIY
jgi:hypothetical protein